ncbi:cysteine synthase A [Actinoplanes teichomyceticus]|uniref:O-acetylserine sulfhydrylase n=1 Tax=Actinoplanes teichomyceticus TaxID=1867 RepID=A0A561WBM0_ACTTI|nr:cysteine synthase A [Actinoplanes teichomyceticus]TWG21267.1 cysteine synthase A [Actinoplanes teichomyceticus]GIF16720.1 O-acetylserine sulfhydrylase [Actinoplanes teichomyceticus]
MTTTALPATRRVAAAIDDLIGNTPLLRLPVDGLAPDTEVIAKLESANPVASVKDRAALFMLRAAEERGWLRPGGTVVEATSGNTGIALAALAAARGYRCVIVLPDNATAERVALLRVFGAEVVQTPRELRYQGCVDRAEEIVAATEGAWFARQHDNAENPRAHRATTGPEIWADTAGDVDILVCGVGTGGTLCGAAAYLKERKPGLRAIAVEPAASPLLSGGEAGTHAIPGYNGGFIAPTTDRELIDEVLTVRDDEAADTTRWLARRAGVLAGISSGAAVHAAIRVARRPDSAGRTIVVLLPDTGERYLSQWSH